MSLTTRYVLLLLVTAAGGIASSFMWLHPNGFMAGCMTFCFSLGTIWLAEKDRRRPGSVDQGHALVAGLVTGLIASIPLLLLETTRPVPLSPEHAMFKPPPLDCWYLIAAPVLYGMAFHWSYHQGRRSAKPMRSAFWRACALTAVIRLGLEAAKQDTFHEDMIEALFPIALFFLVFVSPFPILWTVLTAATDPTWPKAAAKESETVSGLKTVGT